MEACVRNIILVLLFLFAGQFQAQNLDSKISTFLMFEGNAEEAMKYYVSLFDNSEVLFVTRWDDSQPAVEGKIKYAAFMLNGISFMCSDSPVDHDFTFTPSFSVFVNCSTLSELEKLFTSLSDGGNVLMPLNNYGFSKKFGWVEDKFGISWQLNYGELK